MEIKYCELLSTCDLLNFEIQNQKSGILIVKIIVAKKIKKNKK